jgi:prophage regulatory protein
VDQRMVRPAEAAKILSLSVSTLRRLELRGEFPPRIALGANSVGWRLADLFAWMAARPTVRGAAPARAQVSPSRESAEVQR